VEQLPHEGPIVLTSNSLWSTTSRHIYFHLIGPNVRKSTQTQIKLCSVSFLFLLSFLSLWSLVCHEAVKNN
jgi:hypothetical protein